jgi:hypothetical protein
MCPGLKATPTRMTVFFSDWTDGAVPAQPRRKQKTAIVERAKPILIPLIIFPPFVSLKVISPLPLGERARVRGKNGISCGLSPPPFPSPLKGEGFPCSSVSSRTGFHYFSVIILDAAISLSL